MAGTVVPLIAIATRMPCGAHSGEDRRTAGRAAGAGDRLQSVMSQNDGVNITLVEIERPVGERTRSPFSYE